MNSEPLLPHPIRARIPAIGSDMETPFREMVVHARLFDRSGPWQWFILEMDGDDECFGIVLSRAGAVAGRFTLSELQSITGLHGEPAAVAFDGGFEPRTVGQLVETEPSLRELVEVPSPREQRAAAELVDLE